MFCSDVACNSLFSVLILMLTDDNAKHNVLNIQNLINYGAFLKKGDLNYEICNSYCD